MCGGTIIDSTASAVPGSNRLSPPNGLSSCRSQKDKPLMGGGTIISTDAMHHLGATDFLLLMAYRLVVLKR